jgi:hypothetical protein
LRRITGGGLLDAYPIAVAPDGTAFLSAFAIPSLGVPGVTWVASSGAGNVTPIGAASQDVVFWNGATDTTARNRRGAQSLGAGSTHASGFVLRRHGVF